MSVRLLLPVVLLLGLCAPVGAQSPSSPGCELNKAPPTEAPTPTPEGGGNSGTDPGASGSTGWTGGTGGSNIGTTPGAPTSGSPTSHPETATGLNPIDGPQTGNAAAAPKPNC